MWLVILFVVPCTCLAVPGPSTEKQHRMIFSAIKVDEGDIVVRSGEKPGKRSVNWETVRTVNGELVNITWPVKRVASEEGDIILGGLMMVHEREEESTCGRIMRQGGIQALEAMLYTIDYVNRKQFHNHTSFLPGFTLGAYILDDCDKDTYGLEMAVDFIKGGTTNLVYFCQEKKAHNSTRCKREPSSKWWYCITFWCCRKLTGKRAGNYLNIP